MIINKFFRLYAPEPDAGGTDTVDRGDLLEDDAYHDRLAETDVPAKDEVKDDPKVKELEDDLTSKQRATLERQLAQYQQGGQLADMNAELTAAENNIIKMEKEYATLLTDGEVEKASTLMQQIRKTERDMAEAKSDMKIHAAEIRATERARYSTAIERVEAAFPELNPDHDDFNPESAAEVLDLMEAYKSRGLTPTAALQKAVKMIVEPRTGRQQAAVDSTPRVTEKDIAAERKQAAVEKTSKAVAKTPASLGRAGLDSDKLGGGEMDPRAVMKMSQKEFAATN